MCSNENIDKRISRLVSLDSASHSVAAAAIRKTHPNQHKLANVVETSASSVNNTSLLEQLQSTSPYHHHSQSAATGSINGPLTQPHRQHPIANMSSMLGGNSVVPPGILPPLDHYRLQLYNYAVAERLRCSQYSAASGQLPICGPGYPPTAAAAAAAAVSAGNNPYAPSRFALSMSFFHNRVFQPEEPKPQHSYIGLIAMAILNSPETKLVLSDIYQHILDNYPYFRTRGPGWRNSIRHNLSLNDCFIKSGRSANGKGHYWAIHPANLEDFKKGDFRRRKAQRKVRKHMGLAVDDEGTDSSSPPPLALTPPPPTIRPQPGLVLGSPAVQTAFCAQSWAAAAAVHAQAQAAVAVASTVVNQQSTASTMYSQSSRKRQFDVASLLAPDDDDNVIRRRSCSKSPSHPFVESSRLNRVFHRSQPPAAQMDGQNQTYTVKGPAVKRLATASADYDDSENEDIDVVASDAENNNNYSLGHNIPEDNVHFVLGLNKTIVEDDDDDECNIEGDGHKEDIGDDPHQYQSQQQHYHHQFEQDPQMQQHQQKASSVTRVGGDEDNQFTEGSNDSNPGAGHGETTTAAAAAAAASWHGIIQQWPGNFQQHFNNIATPAGTVNTRFLQRYYGQYMAAAAAQQAAVAAVAAKNTQQSGHGNITINKDTCSDVTLVELNRSVDPMTLVSRGDDKPQQKPEQHQQQIHQQLLSVASVQQQNHHHHQQQQQPHMQHDHHNQSSNQNSPTPLHGGKC